MWRKLVLLSCVAGALAFSASAFAINRNGRVEAAPPSGSQIGAARNMAARNHGVAGAAPFHKAGRVGPQVGGPNPKR